MFSDSERNLFTFFDGTREVYGDPLRIQRRLYEHLASPDEVLAACKDPNPSVSLPAVGHLIEAAYYAFELPPFDRATGQGATEEHCRLALEKLWACLDEKKKQPVSCPASPLHTDFYQTVLRTANT